MRIRNFQQKISTAWILSGFVFGMILWLSPFIDNAIGCGPPPCYTCPPCWTGCYCDNYVGCPPCDSSECLQCGASHCTCTSWCSGGTCCHGNCCPYPGMNCCPDGHCCSSGYSCCGNKCCHPGTTHCCSDGPPGSEYYCCPDGQTCCHGHCCVPSACDECVDGLCKVCGGRAYESCCNGSCYDTRTQRCCDDTGTGYKCNKDEACCHGTCIDINATCCEDGHPCYGFDECCNSSCCAWQTECCVAGVCKPRCIPEGDGFCEYTLPPGAPCQFMSITDPHCVPCWGPGCEGMMCEWVTNSPLKINDICQPGCICELSTEPCVYAYTKTCKYIPCWWCPPFFAHCSCEEPVGLVDLVPYGTRTVCGAE